MAVTAEVISSESSRAARAPTDVLRLAVAVGSLLAVVLVGAFFDDAVVGFVADLVRGIEALPSWLVTAVIVIGQILGIVVLVGGAVAALVRRNWLLLAVAAAAAAVAVLLTLVILPLVDDVAPQVARVDESYTPIPHDEVASTLELAMLAAVVTAARPDAQCRLCATPATWSRPASMAA